MRKGLISLLALVVLMAPMVDPVRALPTGELRPQPAVPAQEDIHVVQRGETLFSIAQRYGTTVAAFAHLNGLSDPTRIYIGQRLKIPPSGELEIDPLTAVSYLIQPTDTLSDVARRHATSWQALARLNGLLSPDALHPGQILKVPPVDPVGGLPGALHVVGDDETLFRIAVRHGVSPGALVTANQISNSALLYPGQQLLIPGTGSSRLPAPVESVGVHPLPVSQGGTLVVDVRTSEPVTLTGRLFDRSVRFAEEEGVYYGLAGVHVFTEPGLYELTLVAIDGQARHLELTASVVVESGRFGYERIKASPSLLDPAVVAAEQERLNALRSTFTGTREWSAELQPPGRGSISSYFGTHRAYNDGPYTSYHGGVDFRGPTGAPVYAPAAGTVVFADSLTVRGNALMLDHGWGVLTGYWHLSEIEVGVGEHVDQGDVIARIGNTGLSTGSHLHWEMWVDGVNVNPMEWLKPLFPWSGHTEGSGEGAEG